MNKHVPFCKEVWKDFPGRCKNLGFCFSVLTQCSPSPFLLENYSATFKQLKKIKNKYSRFLQFCRGWGGGWGEHICQLNFRSRSLWRTVEQEAASQEHPLSASSWPANSWRSSRPDTWTAGFQQLLLLFWLVSLISMETVKALESVIIFCKGY